MEPKTQAWFNFDPYPFRSHPQHHSTALVKEPPCLAGDPTSRSTAGEGTRMHQEGHIWTPGPELYQTPPPPPP